MAILLYYAELYQLYGLRIACSDLINGNKHVLETEQWKKLVESGSETAVRLNKELSKQFINKGG